MKQIYDISFYEGQSPYSIRSAHKIVPYVSKLFPDITTVIDVGCGIGGWLNEWKQEGKKVFGIDGNDFPEARKINNNEYLKHDLTQPLPELQIKYDLCMSLEVAEHLPPERADSFIKDLCSYSNTVLFSAAIPGQTGINHINEQWPDYWANLFLANGYNAYDILRDVFWDDNDVAWWYAQNMIIYTSNATPPIRITNGRVLSRVHPKCFMMYYKPINKTTIQKSLSLKQKIKNKIKKIINF